VLPLGELSLWSWYMRSTGAQQRRKTAWPTGILSRRSQPYSALYLGYRSLLFFLMLRLFGIVNKFLSVTGLAKQLQARYNHTLLDQFCCLFVPQ
jgi:hypothetical protein